jgi:hypothetical protein
MLTSVVLRLKPVREAVLPVSHGPLAYAGALDLLLRLSPGLSSQIHDSPGLQPLTVSPLSGALQCDNHNVRLSPSGLCRWRLTSLHRTVGEMFPTKSDTSTAKSAKTVENGIDRYSKISAWLLLERGGNRCNLLPM